jgi:hypothetical protein
MAKLVVSHSYKVMLVKCRAYKVSSASMYHVSDYDITRDRKMSTTSTLISEISSVYRIYKAPRSGSWYALTSVA